MKRWGSFVSGVGRNIRSRLAAGFLLIIPLSLTLLITWYVFTTLDSLFRPLLTRLLGWNFPGIGFALALLLLYLIGTVATSNKGSRLLNPGLAFTERIPLVRTIYLAAKEATKVFSHDDTQRYRRVVLLEFPRPGVKALGLVTATFISPDGEPQLAVYIPTTPNPTSGQLALIPESEVEDAGMSVEAAMRIIISGGILTPGMVGKEFDRPREESLR